MFWGTYLLWVSKDANGCIKTPSAHMPVQTFVTAGDGSVTFDTGAV